MEETYKLTTKYDKHESQSVLYSSIGGCVDIKDVYIKPEPTKKSEELKTPSSLELRF